MQSFKVDLKVHSDSVLHIGTGEGFAGIIDKRTITHHRNNKRFPIIFGHSVKGIIREEFRKLSTIYNVDKKVEMELFGEENLQGLIYFSPWQLSEEMVSLFNQVDTTHLFDVKSSNQIIRSRKVAKPEHLFTHEIVKNNMEWCGEISGTVNGINSEAEISNELLLLLFSIKNVKAIGGKRRSGTGACTVEIITVEVGNKTYSTEQVHHLMKSNVDRIVRGYTVNG